MLRSEDIMSGGSEVSINKRRSKLVLYMALHPDKPNTRLAAKFRVTDQTIASDKKAIMQQGIDWGNEMAQGAFMKECSTQLARMELVIADMEADYRQRRTNNKPNLQLGISMAKLAALKLEVMDNVPMYHKFSMYAKRLEAAGAL